jgi:DNA-binding transcriptional ArsR family regulator
MGSAWLLFSIAATTLNSSSVIYINRTKNAGNNMITNNQPLKQLLGWLITGTKGGKTRAQIIKSVKSSPQNANQLATQLKVDYKTIRHHLTILEKHKLVVPVGAHYSTVYFLSQPMEENYSMFEDITSKMDDAKKRASRITQRIA